MNNGLIRKKTERTYDEKTITKQLARTLKIAEPLIHKASIGTS